MAEMEFVPHTQIDLSEWRFGLDDLFDCPDKVAAKVFTKALEGTLEMTRPNATLPWSWHSSDGINGPPVASPDVIYVDFPLCSDADTGPTWSITIGELVQDYIEGNAADGGNGPFDEEEAKHVRVLSTKLRELADILDAKCPAATG